MTQKLFVRAFVTVAVGRLPLHLNCWDESLLALTSGFLLWFFRLTCTLWCIPTVTESTPSPFCVLSTQKMPLPRRRQIPGKCGQICSLYFVRYLELPDRQVCVCVCVPERLPVRIRACGREPGDPEDVWFSAQSCSTAAEGSVTVKRTTQLKVNAPAMLRFFLCVCFVSPSRTGVGGVQSIFPFKKQIRVKHVLKVYWSKIKGEWNTHVHTFSSGSDLED